MIWINEPGHGLPQFRAWISATPKCRFAGRSGLAKRKKEGEIIGTPDLDKFASDAAFALVDCASDPAFAIDRSLIIVNWNRAARQCLGYAAAEVIGRHCSDVLQAVRAHGEPLCAPGCEGVRCFRRDKTFAADSSYARHKDGGWVPVNLDTVVTSKRVRSSSDLSVLAVVFFRGGEEKRRLAPSGQTLRIFTFGRFGLVAGDNRLATGKWQRKQQALTLLKLLAARVGRAVPREVLSDWLWPEVDERSGRERLKVTMYALRSQLRAGGLNEEIIETVEGGYLLRREAVWLDVEAFDRCVTDGFALQGQERWEDALHSYREAQRLYRGDYLEENIHDDWCAEERDRLHEVHLEMLASMAECYAACGRRAEAVSVCRTILVDDPCREGVHRALMAHLVRLGHFDSAVAQYHHCERILARELDVEPMPETRRLYEQILAGETRAAIEKHDRSAA